MKKILYVLGMIMLMVACGTKETTKADKIKIKVAVVGNENHQSTIMADYFKEELNNLSPGRFEIEIYPNGILGGEREAVEGVKLGSIQMTIVTMDGAVPAWVPDTQIMSIPYLFTTKEKAYGALDGVIKDYLSPLFFRTRIQIFRFRRVGF